MNYGTSLVVSWLRHRDSRAGQETKAPHAAEHGQRNLKKKKRTMTEIHSLSFCPFQLSAQPSSAFQWLHGIF